MIKKIFALLIVLLVAFSLFGCSEAQKANYSIYKQANYFENERRVTVYNEKTDKIIFVIEGFISISNNYENEIIVTAKVGANQYKKNFIYLNDYTMCVVEDISGTHTDPYHYDVYFHPEVLPDVEVKP